MGSERAPTPQEFTLTPTVIFNSELGYALNDFGIACQAILVRQHYIASGLDNLKPQDIQMLNQEIAEIRKRHAIPEEALPLLKNRFDCAVKQQEATVQGIIPNTQGRVLART